MNDVENLNGKEFQGRSIIADKRNATQPLVVRDLNTPVPAKRLPGKGSRAAAPMISESPTFAIGGPVCRPDSSIYPSPASTTSSSFSQVNMISMYLLVSAGNPITTLNGHDGSLHIVKYFKVPQANYWNYNVGGRWLWHILDPVELFQEFKCPILSRPSTRLRCPAIGVSAEQQHHAILWIWAVSKYGPGTTAIYELPTIVLWSSGLVRPINFVPSTTALLQ